MDITKGQSFHVRADHTGANTTTYSLLIDGTVQATLPVSALQGGAITFSNLASGQMAVGAHQAACRATGAGGETTSAPEAFNIVEPAAGQAPPQFTSVQVIPITPAAMPAHEHAA